MSPNENSHPLLTTWFRALALTLCVALALPVAAGESPGAADIVIVSLRGDVRVSMGGKPRAVRAGSVVELPATIRTGRDGAIDLRQGNTTVAIAADSELQLPANSGVTIDRLIQTRGNAFYDVGKREGRKLRVESPYLVAVIKGTQFNVAVQEDSSTISLFEGRLEVRAPDDSDVVDLNAGEIAIRHATDKVIRVLRMDNGKPAATTSNDSGSRSVAPGGPDDGAQTPRVPPSIDDPAGHVAGDPTIRVAAPGGDEAAQITVHTNAASAGVSLDTGEGALDAGVTAGVGDAVAAQVDVGVGLAEGEVGVGAAAQVDLGVASVDAGLDAGVNLGAGTVDAAADVAVDLGAAAADLGVDAAVDLGSGAVDVGADAGVDLGVASLDSGVDLGADLGTGGVDAAVDVGADLGAAAVDAGLDAGLDVPAGAVDVGLDTSVAGADVGVDLGVDLGGGGLGLDIDVGGLDIGLGGADDTTPTQPAAPDNDDGGLLGGLLGGLRRGN